VDKTRHFFQLADQAKYYFLSRPRRFGKSLTVSTLRCLFEGRRDLFEGLWIAQNTDWEWKEHPVILLDFNQISHETPESLKHALDCSLKNTGLAHGIQLHENMLKEQFKELILALHKKTGMPVVILIDEYDKPLIDHLGKGEAALDIAKANRDILKHFFEVMKGGDVTRVLRFVFITGVSKFSKVSLFSGLNNLVDITLSPMFATICGWTEDELTRVFARHLEGKNLEDIRLWYNGYSWLGEKVYNPFSLLNFFREGRFDNYWFQSGTPRFLIGLLTERRYSIPAIEQIEVGSELLGSFDLETMFSETLLFQTGYLTITGCEEVLPGEVLYRLDYPNLEVKKSFSEHLLTFFTQQPAEMKKSVRTVVHCLRQGRLDDLRHVLHSLYAAIPHDWYRKNNLADYEGYYCSVFYCYFTALGLDVRAEDVTNHGNMDMTVLFADRAYIFEFKLVERQGASGKALAQIKARGYAEKYMARAKEVYLIGVEFNREERNITGFQWELAV
jgi:hypothetical protein